MFVPLPLDFRLKDFSDNEQQETPPLQLLFAEVNLTGDIPEMPLDNNDTEREIRAMVMGNKTYLFCQTDEACERAAIKVMKQKYAVKNENPAFDEQHTKKQAFSRGVTEDWFGGEGQDRAWIKCSRIVLWRQSRYRISQQQITIR